MPAVKRSVVGIGLASGFLEPLESTSIHMVQSAVARLLELFPSRGANQAVRDSYNRLTHAEYDGIRDFLILHYRANLRDEPFWQDCRAIAAPDSLQARIDLFREAGATDLSKSDLFTEPAWVQVMTGQGIMPEQWSPLADGLPAPELAHFLGSIRADVARQVGVAAAR
ncbi:MAG: hypothetical protein EOP59_14000 [Sphingomonadales bacterium]|nr:MAG: hypothetical protein EOP59_14000 [Sphingomonadales bacterium]